MKPERVSMYVYADSPDEAAALQDALYDFVNEMYGSGVLVRAEVLAGLLRRYGRSPIVRNVLRDGKA